MIENLLYWHVGDDKVRELGEKVEEINKDFIIFADSLGEGNQEGIVDMYMARSLRKRIPSLRDEIREAIADIEGDNKQTRFDRLVLDNYKAGLFSQQEYVELFSTKAYNREWGIKNYLNYSYFPRNLFENNREENSPGITFLEGRLRKINYRAASKRKKLMLPITTYGDIVNQCDFEVMLLDQIPLLRRIIGEFNIDMGFETREQVEAQDLIAKEKENRLIKERVASLFGSHKEGGELKGKRFPQLDRVIQDLVYDLVLNYEDYCGYTAAVKAMEVNADRFHFYKDPENGERKVYLGDVIRSVGHENIHRLQSLFSRYMPPVINDNPLGYDVAGRVIAEGTATVLEDNFMRWFEKNRECYGISQRDVDVAKLQHHEHFGNRIVRLVHSVYHREETPLETGEDKDAHLRLAKVSNVPLYADDDYLSTESFTETYYYSFYFFGEKYVRETLSELERRETKRLGNRKHARAFLRRNEPLVIQGLLTGQWGWSTHKRFFLSHYWPKARRYCS